MKNSFQFKSSTFSLSLSDKKDESYPFREGRSMQQIDVNIGCARLLSPSLSFPRCSEDDFGIISWSHRCHLEWNYYWWFLRSSRRRHESYLCEKTSTFSSVPIWRDLCACFTTVLSAFLFQMGRWSVAFNLQLHLFCFFTTVAKASQSSDLLPFYSQNESTTIAENDFARRDDSFYNGIALNHSVHRRQVPLTISTSQSARIPITPSYIIVGPRLVRPAQIVAISVTILRKAWDPILVRAMISNDDVAVAVAEGSFMVGVPQTLEMLIPKNIRNGTYRLSVEGNLLTGERKFSNVSQLIFEQKAVSILIQLDRPIYRHETVVQFRCIPIYPDLSGHFHTVDIYILGPSGHILRKWENQQTTAGIVSLEVSIHGEKMLFAMSKRDTTSSFSSTQLTMGRRKVSGRSNAEWWATKQRKGSKSTNSTIVNSKWMSLFRIICQRILPVSVASSPLITPQAWVYWAMLVLSFVHEIWLRRMILGCDRRLMLNSIDRRRHSPRRSMISMEWQDSSFPWRRFEPCCLI